MCGKLVQKKKKIKIKLTIKVYHPSTGKFVCLDCFKVLNFKYKNHVFSCKQYL